MGLGSSESPEPRKPSRLRCCPQLVPQALPVWEAKGMRSAHSGGGALWWGCTWGQSLVLAGEPVRASQGFPLPFPSATVCTAVWEVPALVHKGGQAPTSLRMAHLPLWDAFAPRGTSTKGGDSFGCSSDSKRHDWRPLVDGVQESCGLAMAGVQEAPSCI